MLEAGQRHQLSWASGQILSSLPSSPASKGDHCMDCVDRCLTSAIHLKLKLNHGVLEQLGVIVTTCAYLNLVRDRQERIHKDRRGDARMEAHSLLSRPRVDSIPQGQGPDATKTTLLPPGYGSCYLVGVPGRR
ncbi:uncharacterized protein RBU33_023232 [Hipposideros larvatus]